MVKRSPGTCSIDKMLVNSLGGVRITNDGAKILKEMEAQHSPIKIIVVVAKSVGNKISTSSAVGWLPVLPSG